MSTPDPRHQLQAAADTRWDRYLSCVRSGGTPEQRQRAFDQWRDADQTLARHDRHARNTQRRERAQANTQEIPVVGGTA